MEEKLTDLNELQALISLLRANGVTEYSAGGVSLRLGAKPAPEPRPEQPTTDPVAEQAKREAAMHDAAVKISPRMGDAVKKLPAGYMKYFAAATE